MLSLGDRARRLVVSWGARGLCVAAAITVRDAPQLRRCWAVSATGWVTNNLNTLLAGVRRDLRCNAFPLIFWVSGTARTSCRRYL